MAPPHRARREVRPEHLLARRFARAKRLAVPVDVERAARRDAEFSEDDLPDGIDGVLLRWPEPGRVPEIVVNRGTHPKRKRFTIAHELGHLVIPWHVGSLACNWLESHGDSDITRQLEAEANRFASELLMPGRWVKEIVKTSSGIPEMIQRVKEANVSSAAASMGLCQNLGPGYVFAVVNAKGVVVQTSRSPGTAADAPPPGQPFDARAYGRLAAAHDEIEGGALTTHWWSFETALPTRDRVAETPSSRDLLADILARHGKGAAERMSISGIIGYANTGWETASSDELYNVLRQRFVGRSEFDWFVRDPQFGDFLAARAKELAVRRRG